MTASRREDVEHRYFLRSVRQRLMTALSSSLIVVRAVQVGVLAHPRQILVPVLGGGFNNAERTYLVSKLATHYHAEVIVFHTVEESRVRGRAVPREADARRVRDFVESLRVAGVEPRVRIVTGRVLGEAIMQEAARRRHDLIVMEASQRSLFTQWQRGNPVEEKLRHSGIAAQRLAGHCAICPTALGSR